MKIHKSPCERTAEQWRSIEGYEKYYEVSNLGRVRALDRPKSHSAYKNGRILAPATSRDGYLYVGLWDANQTPKHVTRRIHQLVAKAFISNPDSLPQVNHKDENKSNNCVDNLEWCSAEYNTKYGTGDTRRKINGFGTSPYQRKYCLVGENLNTRETVIFASIAEAVSAGFNRNMLSDAIHGRRNLHKGYAWKREIIKEANDESYKFSA
jgi:hypothetical protein